MICSIYAIKGIAVGLDCQLRKDSIAEGTINFNDRTQRNQTRIELKASTFLAIFFVMAEYVVQDAGGEKLLTLLPKYEL